MTQEQYNAAVTIYLKKKQLKEVLCEIQPASDHMLSYVTKRNEACSKSVMRIIGEILDKHDAMIREEIQQEIESLEKSLENL